MKKCMLNDAMHLFGTPATDEEYAKRMRGNIKWMAALIVIGAVALALGALNEIYQFVEGQDLMSGFYSGLGSALVAIGIINIINIKKLLKNPQKLHARRIENYDERKAEITRRAVTTSFVIFGVLLLAMMLVVGFFERTVFRCCYLGFMSLALIFIGATRYYEKKL